MMTRMTPMKVSRQSSPTAILWLGKGKVEEVTTGGGWAARLYEPRGHRWWMREEGRPVTEGYARWSRCREGGGIVAEKKMG
jgi:hypothetical protein